MSDGLSDLKRVLKSSGIYAAAAVAQRGLAFILLPVYTRFIEPAEYGVLELLTVFSTVIFGVLMLGMPSAVMKCYHRDCETDEDRRSLLATSVGLMLPALLVGGGLLLAAAPTASQWLLGRGDAEDLFRLAIVTGILTSATAVILSSLRAQERALAFSAMTLTQFVIALSLNVLLVVRFGMGVRGVLIGNLVSNAVALPLALIIARRGAALRFNQRLVPPLLRFGLLLIPVVLSGWVINMSDRYVLRLFGDLSDVAVYGVGYKFGLIIELAVVWPFQLAWPAVSFSISHRENHRKTYARVLTYVSALLAYLVVALSLGSRFAVPWIVGEGYEAAYRVVPLVALSYALNGVQYCLAPGVHVAEKTKYLTFVSVGAAVLNLVLNFLLIPRWGMMGAAWATAISFLVVAVVTGLVAQTFHKVRYENDRLLKIGLAATAVFLIGMQVSPDFSWFSLTWYVILGGLAFPVLLYLVGFVEHSEREFIANAFRRYAPFFGR